jgi:hypothetical protein
MKKYLLIIFVLFFLSLAGTSQVVFNGHYVKATVIDEDTLILIDLPTYEVIGRLPYKFRKQQRRNDKLVRNIKKVYPYAKLAGVKLNEYEEILKNAPTDTKRRKIMKQAEQELKDEFEDDLKKLTFSQGLILIKLVDRETGDSSYELVQELRGKFTAFFWQAFARLFGYNLKVKYDPLGEDKDIENVVVMIEQGEI